MNPFLMSPVRLDGGEVYYLHNSTASRSCAFSIGDRKSIRLCAPRHLGVYRACAQLYAEHGEPLLVQEGSWISHANGRDEYEFRLPKSLAVGLYFFDIELSTSSGMLYAHKVGDTISFSYNKSDSHLQISISDFKYEEPKQAYGGVIYHIFVDRFAKSNVKKTVKRGANVAADWSHGIPEYPEYPGAPLKNNTFWGGDLWGVIDKLPYIASLGVNVIYLSPIFDAASNHKYDVGDYMNVDGMFGGEKALKALIKEADKMGIGIVLDGVFNHTGDDSLYFNRYGNYKELGAYQSPASPYYDWYDFKSYPDDYTSWWGIEILPRIHPDKEGCRNYFVGPAGVIKHYAKMGILGMRLDVVDELSDSFVADIKSRLNESNPHSLLYGEVWEDASNKVAYGTRKQYFLGSELDGVMNYPLRKGIINYLLNTDITELQYALTDIISHAPKRVADAQMNILGTHDTERILTVLGGVSGEGKSNECLKSLRMTPDERTVALARLKQAYTILATLPGIPSIFYGDEAGLEGYHDPFNRMPYPWGEEDATLVAFYKSIGKLRRKNSVYERGEFKLLELNSECLIFARYHGTSSYVTVVNNTKNSMRISSDNVIKPLLTNATAELAPMSSLVFRTRRGSNIYYDFTI